MKGIEHKNLLHPEPEAREYMHWRKTSKYKLDDFRTEDVKWVLAREGIPDPKGSTAAGEDRHLRDGTFYFRKGNLVTLAEMFRFGSEVCTCFDIYRTFVHLPIFAYKRAHSSSGSDWG